jgi:hypothetical protein
LPSIASHAGNDLRKPASGVVSATTLAGHAKSLDTHAYLIAMTVTVLAAVDSDRVVRVPGTRPMEQSRRCRTRRRSRG